jgi:glutaredoxin
LDAKKVAYDTVDIAADEKAREHMRAVSGKALIPQIFVDGKYKGVRLQYTLCGLRLDN